MRREVDRKQKGTDELKPGATEGTSLGSKPRDKEPVRRGWSDIFDNITYSDGPGDNIYVFG